MKSTSRGLSITLVVVAALVIAAWLAWRAQDTTSTIRPATESAGAPSATRLQSEPAEVRLVPIGSREPAVQTSSNQSNTLRIDGTLVIVEADGSTTNADNATLTLALKRGRRRKAVVVDVERGKWSLELAERADGALLDMDGKRVLGSSPENNIEIQARRPKLLDSEDGLTLLRSRGRFEFGARNVYLRAQRSRPTRLFVTDATTGDPLGPVTVLRAEAIAFRGRGHPGDQSFVVLTTEGGYPTVLPTSPGSEDMLDIMKLFVSCPDYAWAPVEVNLTTGGDRPVPLQPAGGLDVSFDGELPRSAYLRLYDTSSTSPYVEKRLPDARAVSLRQLHPGSYRVQIEKGYAHTRKVIALGSAEVRARSISELRLGPVAEEARVEIAGRFIIPNAWELDGFSASFTRTAPDERGRVVREVQRLAMERSVIRPDVYTFTVAEIPSGTYAMSFDGGAVKFGDAFEVGPAGRGDLEFELAPPVDVTITILDEADNSIAPVEELAWWVSSIPSAVRVRRTAEENTFRLQVPEQAIELKPHGGDYLPTTGNSWQVAADQASAFELPARRCVRVSLRLMDGSTHVPWPLDDTSTLRKQHRARSFGTFRFSSDGELTVKVRNPGVHTFQVPTIAGYKPQSGFEAKVTDARQQLVLIPLERE